MFQSCKFEKALRIYQNSPSDLQQSKFDDRVVVYLTILTLKGSTKPDTKMRNNVTNLFLLD